MTNESLFDQNVSLRIQKAAARLVCENYRLASRFVYRNFDGPQAHDLSGHFRRAKIEENLAGLPDLFPELSVEVKKYENETGYYNEVTCQQVKLTQSCVSSPNDVPRIAKFRSTLAFNGQLCLLFRNGDSEDASDAEPQYLYAILTHGVDVNADKRAWPAYIRVQFPNAALTRYQDEGINLFRRFPDLVKEFVPKSAYQFNRRRQREYGVS